MEIYIDCGDFDRRSGIYTPHFTVSLRPFRSAGKATVKVTEQTLKTVEDALAAAQIKPNGVFFEQGAQQNSVRVRFAPTDGELQLRSRDVLEKH